MHAVMDTLMRARFLAENEGDTLDAEEFALRYIGTEFHYRVLTEEHIDTMILPALGALRELEYAYGDGFKVKAVEARVKFPGVAGAGGTCDLILTNHSHVVHVDWKFGQGVAVEALYTDVIGEYVNPQLMFYATAAFSTLPKLYRRKKMAVAIIQPRSDTPLTHTEITRRDIKWFREDVEDAVIMAQDHNPPRARGEWCRFAACKVDCPLWTGPLLDLSAIGVVSEQATDVTSPKVTPYGEYLAKAKALCDGLAMFSKEVNEQLHAFLDDGGQVPGWRLKAKVKMRQWVDEDMVGTELLKIGFKPEDVWQQKLVTFQKADAAAKRLGVKIPAELRVAPATTETTVCPTSDPAPVVERQLAISEFSAALKQLTAKDY
jgi:hypothetical protein